MFKREPHRADSYRFATTPTQRSAASKPNEPQSNATKTSKQTKAEELDLLSQELDFDDHRIPIEELYQRLNTNPIKGLSTTEAARNLERDGANLLDTPPLTPFWIRLLSLIFGGFNLLLWVGALLAFLSWLVQIGEYASVPMDDLWLCLVLIGVVIILGVFNVIVDRISVSMVEKVERYVPQQCTVIREGVREAVLADQLVVGDIIELKAGDRVAADMRVISAENLKVDNSQLTGDLESLTRTPEYTSENPLETRNLLFFQSNVIEGNAKAVVIFTGENTVVGKIANLASQQDIAETNVSVEVTRYLNVVLIVGILLGALWFAYGFILDYVWLDAVYFFIGMVCANVPEALLSIITLCLALAARRMSMRNVYVRDLESIVKLSSVCTICTQKTGALTQARMLLAHLWVDGHVYEADVSVEQTQADAQYRSNPTFQNMLRVLALCNRSEFTNVNETNILSRRCTGDPTDAALLRFAEITLAGGGVENLRLHSVKVCEVPFNPYFKFHVCIYRTEDDPRFYLILKGAPERVLERCGSIMVAGQEYALDDRWRDNFWQMMSEVGGAGERVLACADLRLDANEFPPDYTFDPEEQNFPLIGLRFLGAVALLDPPRPGISDSIKKCKDAKINPIIITGEHPITAKAIAKQIGLIGENSMTLEDVAARHRVAVTGVNDDLRREVTAAVVNGGELRDMTTSQIEGLVLKNKELVFARLTPQQKLLVIDACQKLGQVVAATGDSVYDSASLRKADIGVALGETGVDVCKKSADIILADDSFASMVAAVEEGRFIFDNLRKAITYTMANKVPEVVAFLLFLVAEMPLPISTLTILYCDIGTDLLPAIALAFEDPEPDIMKRPARDPHQDKLINQRMLCYSYLQIGMIECFAAFFTYFVCMSEAGFWPFRLLDLRQEWDSRAINDVEDSYGQEWSYWQRKHLEWTINTAFLDAIVVCQWVNLIISKTRRSSILQVGMKNHMLTGALLIETALALFITYMPFIQQGLRVGPIRFTWWLPALPYAIIMLLYDELRKLFIRLYPGSWLEVETGL